MDSLKSSYISEKTDIRLPSKTDLLQRSAMVSPIGEWDIIKSAQTIPGVSSGSEGSSSFYVRGGDKGNNMMFLDGVRIYGAGHLFGLSAAVPQDIVSSAQFYSGNFVGAHTNMLSSVIDVKTIDGDFNKPQTSFSISTFSAGGGVSVPIMKNRLSVMAYTRVSPFGREYNFVSGLFSDFGLDLPKSMESQPMELFVKATWLTLKKMRVSLSCFNTRDDYKLLYQINKWDQFGWRNQVTNLFVSSNDFGDWTFTGNVSINNFSNWRRQFHYPFTDDDMVSVESCLNERTITVQIENNKSRFCHALGGKLSSAFPRSFLGNLWYHIYGALGKISLSSTFRGSCFVPDYSSNAVPFLDPEIVLSAIYNVDKNLTLNLSADYLSQYYHVVEGFPMGWSMDFYIPASDTTRPEHSFQVSGGMSLNRGRHSASFTGYYKKYQNLVYFTDEKGFFNQDVKNDVSNTLLAGEGRSYGLEMKYTYKSQRMSVDWNYTLSRSIRRFDGISDDDWYPARFDRPHILNLNMEYTLKSAGSIKYGLTGFFTLQSGHNESIRTGIVEVILPWKKEGLYDYYGNVVNNYRMPTVIRLDIGTCFQWKKGKCSHCLNIGIYNILNRYNPSFIFFDQNYGEWKTISLFPIMPTFNYKITI